MTPAPAAAYIPPPEILPGFPGAERVRPKGIGRRRRARWRLPDGRILEWDSQHGTIEAYDRRGRHQGEFDPLTGEELRPAIPGRQVEP
jgi:hypothetical protein